MTSCFLMRHAESEPGERNDSSRELTDQGTHQANVMAEFLRREIGRVDIIITSPYRRAMDTAVIVAEALGCQRVQQSGFLEPDGTAELAWSDIQTAAGKLENVLVVTHAPLIMALIEKLAGAKTNVQHGAAVRIDMDPNTLLWLVWPKLIERDHDAEMADAVADIAEAVVELAGAHPVGESLKLPKHADVLRPIRAEAVKVIQRFFRRQKVLLLKKIDGKLKTLGSKNHHVTVAEDPAKPNASKDAISAAVADGMLLPLAVTKGMGADYASALTHALTSGYGGLADDFGADSKISNDVMGNYLRDNSLTKLSGDLDVTTVKRLRTALADAYEAGDDYQGMVDAITEEYADFSTARAELISQTELNNAYNRGRKALGVDIGADEKSWATDGPNPCPECIENELAGWIAMDDEFPSGDDIPSGHPGCFCSLDVRITSPGKAKS